MFLPSRSAKGPFHRLCVDEEPPPQPVSQRCSPPRGFLYGLLYCPDGVWWRSHADCRGLLDELKRTLVLTHGEPVVEKLCRSIDMIRDSGSMQHRLLLWITALSIDISMQAFVCGLGPDGVPSDSAPVHDYVGPDGVRRLPECPLAVDNYLRCFYRELLVWMWNGQRHTDRLYDALQSFWVHAAVR